jgi:hypothetical protein
MPTDKDFKRLVRGRMQKTGESYTAARAQLLQLKSPSSVRAIARAKPVDYAALAGKRDAVIKAATGCTWERWVKALDLVEAHTWPHREIAKHVRERYHVSGWWSQTVTVGYERIKGLRAVGQRMDGTFEANKSRTVAVPVRRLYAAFRNSRQRAQWLPDAEVTVRTASPAKYMRLGWPDGTPVVIGFTAMGRAKSQVAIQHGKLPDRASVLRLKQFWGERLNALAEVLASQRRA